MHASLAGGQKNTASIALTDYGQQMPISVMYVMGDWRQMASKPLSSMHSAKLLHSTSGLWLAADRHYSVMASGLAGSN